MQYKITRVGNAPSERAILFFNGWAMTPESVEHLALPEGYDLITLWDYRDLHLPADLDLSAYERIDLVAWSMGVWAADRVVAGLGLPLGHAVAVCGTGYPMSDAWGIPVAIFEGTLNGLTEANRTRFNRRMCGGRTYRHLFEALERRSTDEIRDELACVYRSESSRPQMLPLTPTAPWTLALVGGDDRIIPADNQEAYWAGQGVAIRYDAEAVHYLLGQYSRWEELWS